MLGVLVNRQICLVVCILLVNLVDCLPSDIQGTHEIDQQFFYPNDLHDPTFDLNVKKNRSITSPTHLPTIPPIPAKPLEDTSPPQILAISSKSAQELTIPSKSPQEIAIPSKNAHEFTIPSKSVQGFTIPSKSVQELTIPSKSPQELTIPSKSPQEITIASKSPQEISVIPTIPSVPQFHLTVRKCCPVGHVFSHAQSRCIHTNLWTFIIPVFMQTEFGVFEEVNVTENQVLVDSGLLECDQQFQLDVYPDQEPSFQLRVLDSGSLWVPEYDMEYLPSEYCLETFVSDAEQGSSLSITGGAVCVVQEEEPQLFDPEKVPVRKCCGVGMVYHHTNFNCVPRSNLTEEVWFTPLSRNDSEEVFLVDILSSEYLETHEIVPDFQTCSREEVGDVLQLQDGQVFIRSSDGMLWLSLLNRYLSPGSYCLEDFYADGILLPSVYVCLSEPEAQILQQMREPDCQREPCVPKCCPRFSILDRTMHSCVPEREALPHMSTYHLNGSYDKELRDADYRVGFPSCSNQYLTSSKESAQLLPSGELRYISFNPDECQEEQVYRVPKGDFCYDRIEDIDGSIVDGAVLCFKDDWTHLGISEVEEQSVYYVYSVFLAISDFFILVSFIVYLTVPDQTQRGLNKNMKLAHTILGRILLCFLFSLFFAYLCLIIIKTASDPINLASPSSCIALGVSTYVFFMATFFWLNVLCFELWYKCARQDRTSTGRRWFWYQLYAWCSPLLFGAVTIFMELSPSVDNCYLKPKFGTYSCFFSFTKSHNNGAKWAYFFGPVAILLLADLLFFILTVKSLMQTVQQSHKGTVQRQSQQRLKLCFKLFLVMGISWLAEIISFQIGPRSAWYISDVINCFQGFIIFLIFILKPKIMASARERLCPCGKETQQSRTKNALNFSSSIFTERTSSTFTNDSDSYRAKSTQTNPLHARGVNPFTAYDISTSSNWRKFETKPSYFVQCMPNKYINNLKTNHRNLPKSGCSSTISTLSSNSSRTSNALQGAFTHSNHSEGTILSSISSGSKKMSPATNKTEENLSAGNELNIFKSLPRSDFGYPLNRWRRSSGN